MSTISANSESQAIASESTPIGQSWIGGVPFIQSLEVVVHSPVPPNNCGITPNPSYSVSLFFVGHGTKQMIYHNPSQPIELSTPQAPVVNVIPLIPSLPHHLLPDGGYVLSPNRVQYIGPIPFPPSPNSIGIVAYTAPQNPFLVSSVDIVDTSITTEIMIGARNIIITDPR